MNKYKHRSEGNFHCMRSNKLTSYAKPAMDGDESCFGSWIEFRRADNGLF